MVTLLANHFVSTSKTFCLCNLQWSILNLTNLEAAHYGSSQSKHASLQCHVQIYKKYILMGLVLYNYAWSNRKLKLLCSFDFILKMNSIENWSFCQLVILSTGHFVNWSFCQLVICQLFIMSTGHFVNKSYCQLGILSTRHFVKCQLYLVIIFS